MSRQRIRIGSAVVATVALALAAGCGGSDDEPPPEPTATATGQPAEPSPTEPEPTPWTLTGNGALYVWESEGNEPPWAVTVLRYPIDESGDLGPATPIASGPADHAGGPRVVDAAGDTVLIGDYTWYWTQSIDVHDLATGQVTSTVAAPRWCGGEGLTDASCALVGADLLVRTSELFDPEVPDATLTVTSLDDGSDITSWGPMSNLVELFGTSDPDSLLVLFADPDDDKGLDVRRWDVTSGESTSLGTTPRKWLSICPIGDDALLGWTSEDPGRSDAGDSTAVVVGDATIADVSWDGDKRAAGCSNDGRFLYLEHGGGSEPVVVERVSLVDGSTAVVLTLEQGIDFHAMTR